MRNRSAHMSGERVGRTQVTLTNVLLLVLANESKMLISLKSCFCGEMWSFDCDLSVVSDMEALALSEVLKMCHCLRTRRPLVPSFGKLSEQNATFAIAKSLSWLDFVLIATSGGQRVAALQQNSAYESLEMHQGCCPTLHLTRRPSYFSLE